MHKPEPRAPARAIARCGQLPGASARIALASLRPLEARPHLCYLRSTSGTRGGIPLRPCLCKFMGYLLLTEEHGSAYFYLCISVKAVLK